MDRENGPVHSKGNFIFNNQAFILHPVYFCGWGEVMEIVCQNT